MAHRGSRGGRGEALRQLLQKASEAREEEEAATSGNVEVGVLRSTSQAPRSLGRSAALAKLLENVPSRGGREPTTDLSTYSPKRESLPTRELPRSSTFETETAAVKASSLRHSLPTRGPSISALSSDEADISAFASRPIASGIGRVRFDSSLLERGDVSSSRYPLMSREVQPPSGYQEELEESVSQLTLSDDKPAVIKKGSYGREADMVANYIRLKIEEGKGVFQYDVKFNPDVDATYMRIQLIKLVKDIIGETRSFDGAVLYLPWKLPEKVTTAHLKLPTTDAPVTMKITFVKQLRMGDQSTVHLYNVLFRKIMNILGLVLHGKHFYDPMTAIPIPAHKLEVWPGYITAIQEYEDGVMLCCDASHRVLRTQTVLELMHDLISIDSRQWKEEFLKLIIGQTVLTRYNNRVYRIDDVSFEETPQHTFDTKSDGKISYMDYYYEHYNIRVKDKGQPLLKSRVKGRIKGKGEFNMVANLIPELCFLTGITDTHRADMRVMKDIAQCTRISPSQRHFALKEFINNVNKNAEAKKILSSWGLSLASGCVQLKGRVIPPEDIIFANNAVHRGNFNADWNKAATCNSVISAMDLRRWAVICTNRDERTVSTFIDMFKKCAPQLGLKVNQPELLPLPNDSIQTYIKCLQSTTNQNFQILTIVFPVCRVDKYSAVKKWCCVENPIPSQVVLTRTIRKPDKLRSVTQKIALQMNCKLGGALWTVEIPVKCAMVVGLDSFHDSLRKGKSVSAIVASLNKPLTRWYSKVFIQNPGLELLDGLEVSFLACLKKFRDVNNVFPEQIAIYRDGVGDGDLNMVEQYELPQLIKACRRISPDYDPKFLFVIVQKRINTRLFTEERNELINPAPGSVMDHTITRKHYWDFFLVSQNVKQGTVSPTHYIVLYNTTKMNPDQVQRFTYKLTHLYYNWCGTVRVPAPCQYAHKLAALVGESLHKEASETLADKLFFL